MPTEQQAMIQDYAAVRGQSQSPRGGREQPYSLPVGAGIGAGTPISLAVDGPPLRGTHAQTNLRVEGEQNDDPMSSMVRMTQELIASIQTSTDGVTTETVTMRRAMVARREMLNEHLESVPSSLMT
eukprot:294136-Amphidinium_carterae.1